MSEPFSTCSSEVFSTNGFKNSPFSTCSTARFSLEGALSAAYIVPGGQVSPRDCPCFRLRPFFDFLPCSPFGPELTLGPAFGRAVSTRFATWFRLVLILVLGQSSDGEMRARCNTHPSIRGSSACELGTMSRMPSSTGRGEWRTTLSCIGGNAA